MFGIFDSVYDFVHSEPSSKQVPVPAAVLRELSIALGLLPLLSVSLDKDYLEDVFVCDASSTFGFGVTKSLPRTGLGEAWMFGRAP